MRRRLPIAITVLVLCMTLARAWAAETVKVLIVSGQSNAVGFNNIKEYRKG